LEEPRNPLGNRGSFDWHENCVNDFALADEPAIWGNGRLSNTGEVESMASEVESPGLALMATPPIMLAASAALLHFLPGDVVTGLVAWVLASFPIGVLIGHCALSEQ